MSSCKECKHEDTHPFKPPCVVCINNGHPKSNQWEPKKEREQ